MIAPQLVQQVNDIRTLFLQALKVLERMPSFATLLTNSERLRAEFREMQRVAASPRLQQPCAATFTCALVGSSGDGKTSIMAELFPELARRGWLQTDRTDTTSQALIVSSAPPGTDLEEVVVHSWNVEQITRLVQAADAENADARIICRYQPTLVEVDGTEAIFAANDRQQFKFDVRQQLRPLPGPYSLAPHERLEPHFIRTLTVKEESSKVSPDPVLQLNGQVFHTLHLRAIVKAISLRDSFQQIEAMAGPSAGHTGGLVFVDTPGLNVSGSIKDEVLRNVLGKKNQQIIIELLRNDELDLIVHLVLCGNQSAFSRLWRAVREQCEADELAELGDRLVLAINGANLYFTNPDLKRKWSDPGAADREGDQFAITLEDNILKKMGESGTVRPARICFLDSQRIVEAGAGPYQEVYARYRPILLSWARPGGIGYRTLERLGLVESFTANIDALCDPSDRGQGFLVRQILELAREKGPKLFLRKNLRRSRLHFSLKRLRDLVKHYYDAEGRLNRQAIQAAVRRCLNFLNPEDMATVDSFCRQSLDQTVDRLVPGPEARANPERWVKDAFNATANQLRSVVLQRSVPPREIQALFDQFFREQVNAWKSQWGYRTADLPPPSPQQPGTADLLRHCLRFHVREILQMLLVGDKALDGARSVVQSPQDQEQMQRVLASLDQAVGQAAHLCQQYGVPDQ